MATRPPKPPAGGRAVKPKRHPIQITLIAAGALVVLVAAVLGLAYAFIPREWVNREAQRQAALMSGGTVTWKSLEPGFDGLSLGVRLGDLAVTMPKEGEPRMDLRAKEVFVRFRLLPLLFHRVEIAAAKVKDAGVAMWDRGPVPKPAGAGTNGGGMSLIVPKIELDGIDVRTRDLYGSGVDLRGIHGTIQVAGTLEKPASVDVDVTADSLYWKASARDPLLALPSPLEVDVAMKGARAGTATKLDVTKGTVMLGPLKSEVKGSVTLPPAPEPARLDLSIVGEPQDIKSTDEAFHAVAAKSPATWSTKASWNVKVAGTSEAPVQSGIAKLAPVSVQSGTNKFELQAVNAGWRVTPDQRFTANADGGGSGLTFRLDVGGSVAPGGASNGTFHLDAPAARLNGLLPNTPTWTGGALNILATFTSQAPAPPVVQWTLRGSDLSGTAPGVQPPIKKLAFVMAGHGERVDIQSLDATVGSTTAHATGQVTMGKPLGTGEFTAHVDRFVAEEWTPPKGPPGKVAAAGKSTAPPPAIPFRRLSGNVTVGQVEQAKMVIKDVSLPILYENGTLAMNPIKGALGTGSLAGAVTIHDLITKPSYAVKLDVIKAPVEQFTRGMVPFKLPLSGFMSGDVSLSGPGLPGSEVTDELKGSLTGTVEDGRIQENESLTRVLGLLGFGDDKKGLPFKTIQHALRIDRGRLILDKVKGDLGADRFELTGGLGLDKTMNLGLLLRLAPERVKGNSTLAKFAQLARDPDGRLPLELGIGGTTDAPKVQLKAGKFFEIATQGMKENLTKKLAEAIEKQLAPPPAKEAPRDSTGASASTDSTRAHPDSTAAPVHTPAPRDTTKRADPLDKLRKLLGK